MIVRGARPADLDRLAALFTRLVEHHGGGPRFALRPGAEDELRRVLEGRLRDPDARVLVAEEGSDLPGLCVARVARRPALFRETERGEIEALSVREECRRRGVGRALADAAFAWLAERGVDRVEIEVARGNREGQAFWRELGFRDAMDVLERRL